MSTAAIVEARPRDWTGRLWVYYGWVCVLIAAGAMTATLPGRTHGLGLITEPVLVDLSLSRTSFAWINAVCTLLGALFCLPVGWMIDRFGVRRLLTGTLIGLAVAVIAMSFATSAADFAASLLFVRGLGQGALSVISLSIVGKWFERRNGPAMGLFAVLLTIGFIASILALGSVAETQGWREAWRQLGYVLAASVPLAWFLARDTPESVGLLPDGASSRRQVSDADTELSEVELTWLQALRTPAFWGLTAASALFNFVWSGLTLYNESILVAQGLNRGVAVQFLAALTGLGLLANLVAGALATRRTVLWLMGAAMTMLALALGAFPFVRSEAAMWIYASALGLAGGVVTVIFFAAWGHLYGRKSLGRIQGSAQVATILASATGPAFFATLQERTGSYHSAYWICAGLAGIAAIATFLAPVPVPPAPQEAPANPA